MHSDTYQVVLTADMLAALKALLAGETYDEREIAILRNDLETGNFITLDPSDD